MYRFYKQPFLKLITYLGKKKENRHFVDPPLYIGGCARSGTTILLSVLSAHKDIFACPDELGLYSKTLTDSDGRKSPARIDRLYRTILMKKVLPENKMWCEKSPNNIHHIDDINSYHKGKFKFIQIIRDGRDVVLSNHPTAPERKWVSPERWVKDVKAGLKYANDPRVLTIKYEDIILNYKESAESICRFLEIPLSDEILNWYKNATVSKNRAYFGKVKPLSDKSIGKWKKAEFKDQVSNLIEFPGANELLKHYAYEV